MHNKLKLIFVYILILYFNVIDYRYITLQLKKYNLFETFKTFSDAYLWRGSKLHHNNPIDTNYFTLHHNNPIDTKYFIHFLFLLLHCFLDLYWFYSLTCVCSLINDLSYKDIWRRFKLKFHHQLYFFNIAKRLYTYLL